MRSGSDFAPPTHQALPIPDPPGQRTELDPQKRVRQRGPQDAGKDSRSSDYDDDAWM